MKLSLAPQGKKFLQVSADAYAQFLSADYNVADTRAFTALFPALSVYLKKHEFKARSADIVGIPVQHDDRLVHLIFAGVGEFDDKVRAVESYRRALARAIRYAQQNTVASLAIQLPDAKHLGVTPDYLLEQTAIIAHMTDYVFDTFKEASKTRVALELMLVGTQDNEAARSALERGTIIAQAVNDARQWVNLPANIMRPDELASQARQIAQAYDLSCRVFSEKEIQKMGMGGLAAVASGSEQDCCLVTLEYRTTKKNAPTIGLVGKGITFDSGGLDLKPASNMEIQKVDMSGAAAVIATMKALAQLKPAVNVIAVAPIAENLPSGVATKPGDIVRMYNGKTVEIKNTDAEGRLILADALAYLVKKYGPDALIDLATLTAACEHALGLFFSGVFSVHDKLKKQLITAAEQAGEPVWQLPLTDDYKKAMASEVADLCNIAQPKYRAGATMAAIFLQHFVGETPWVHVDIAGTAFDVPDIPYHRREMATGVGVRLLVQLVSDWDK